MALNKRRRGRGGGGFFLKIFRNLKGYKEGQGKITKKKTRKTKNQK